MKTILLALSLTYFAAAKSKAMSLICNTGHNEMKIVIEDDQVALMKTFEATRSFASNQLVKTQKNKDGFKKVFYKGHNKYKIVITDINNLNEIEDYLTIVSKNGHQMTYPLTCSL